MRSLLIAASMTALAATPAAAQGVDDLAGLLAAAEEHFGQSVGEAMVGGQSVFVTAKGVAKVDRPAGRTYGVTVDGVADTAVEAGKVRDAKLDRLRAVAKRFSAEMTLGDSTYSYGTRPPGVAGRVPPLPIPAQPGSSQPPARVLAASMFTAATPVRFVRPPESAMPAFVDALHEAGVETLNDPPANANIFLQATETLGFGAAGGEVDQAVWDKAMTAAVVTARRQADTLAAAGGRHVGDLREVMLLTKTVKGSEAMVTVAARFGFAK